jgi:hypothetical protein
MQSMILRMAGLALVWLLSTTVRSQAQGTFHVELWEQQGAIQFYGGFSSFAIAADVGQFEVNIISHPGSYTPAIITPSGNLTFPLGTGTPTEYWWGTQGDRMYGIQYVGTFQSSATLLSDLLSGLGEFQLVSDTGVRLSGPMSVVPESNVAMLLLVGLAALALKGIRRR